MSRVKVALLLSAVAHHSTLIISFVAIAVIARLMTPSEIGVFAVASAVSMLATEIRTFGVNQYLVREVEVSEDKKSTALGVMIVICWVLALTIILAAPSIATFYNEPDLKFVFWILSGSFVLAPFATVPYAMIIREMRFDLVLRIKLSVAIASALLSIAFVLIGWSYLGLAAASLMTSVVELIAITLADKNRTIRWPSMVHWKEVLSFGAFASGAGLAQRLSMALPELIIGRAGTMADVGLFSRGFGLVLFLERLINLAIRPVVLPHLSEIRRSSGDVSAEYLRCVVLHGAVALPAFACAGILADPLIDLFFGNQWGESAHLATVLATYAIFQSFHTLLPAALIAIGCEKVALTKELTVMITRLPLILLAAPFGLTIVAISISISGLIEFVVSSLLASRYLGISFMKLMKAQLPNIILTSLVTVTCLVCFQVVEGQLNSFFELVVVGSVTSGVWLASLWLLKHELWFMINSLVAEAKLYLR